MKFLDVAKFSTLTPLSLLISCKLSFPVVGLEVSSLAYFGIESPNKICLWYLLHLSNTHSNSSWDLSSTSSVLSFVGA
jgi:hypothetical protein